MDKDNTDNNPPRILATRDDEELPIVVYDEDQSATPTPNQHAWILYYYAAMIRLRQFQNIQFANIRRLDYNPTTLPQSTRGAQQHDTADVTTTPRFTLQGNRRFGIYWGEWLAIVTFYIAINALLVTFIQLKFQSETDSPFQTHLGFIIMSIAALFMTLILSGIVTYTKNDLQSLMKDHFSPVYDMILKCVLCFSAILTTLTLLLLLFVPKDFKWVGYLLVCALFVAILAFNFHSLKRLLRAKHTNN